VALIAAADPAGDDPALAGALDQADFVVVQELFLTETAKKADVVLPVQAYTEREGTFTSGERRVQRYFPAVPPQASVRADFAIAAQLAGLLGLSLPAKSAAAVMAAIAGVAPAYSGLSYEKVSETVPQWPAVGRSELYYGGTIYDNTQGLGIQLPLTQDGADAGPASAQTGAASDGHGLAPGSGELLAVPVTRLYDRGQTLLPSTLLHQRLTRQGAVWMNPASAAGLGLADGQPATMQLDGTVCAVLVGVKEGIPDGVVLVPRSVGLPVSRPVNVRLAPSA